MGVVVAYEPSPDSAAERRERRRKARQRIAALERRQFLPARELALDPGNAEALKRLRDLDAEIANLRKEL